MKKLSLLFAALFCIISANAASLYLTPNSNWKVDNACFSAYFFEGEKYVWSDMTAVTTSTDVYEVSIPDGYSNVIFCRMNPAKTENSWDFKWNQTVDLTIPSDGTNHYIIADGAWDKGEGTWSTYGSSSGNSGTKEYYIAGWINNADYTGTDYKFISNQLNVTFEADSYIYITSNDGQVYDVAEGLDWINQTTGEATLTKVQSIPPMGTKIGVAGNKELTFTLAENADGSLSLSFVVAGNPDNGDNGDNGGDNGGGATNPTFPDDYYLCGYINGSDYASGETDWNNAGEYHFTGNPLQLTVTFTEPSYVYIKSGDCTQWYMGAEYIDATNADEGSIILANSLSGTSEKFGVPGNKELTFTLEENTNGTLTLSFAITTDLENVTATKETVVKTIENGQLILIRDNVKYNVLGAQVK